MFVLHLVDSAASFFFFQAEDGIRDLVRSRGLGDVYKRQQNTSFREQLKVLKDPKVLKYCQFYSIVFGGYVALALWMVQYYVGEFGLDIRTAALLAACFSLPGGVLRAFGGWMSDKWGAHSVTWWVMWVSWICLLSLIHISEPTRPY